MKRGTIELARTICEEICGELPDGEQYGSVDVAEILSAYVRRLEAQRAEGDALDAARYRWLREKDALGTGPGLFLAMRADGVLVQMTHDFADHRIDEDMKRESMNSHQGEKP